MAQSNPSNCQTTIRQKTLASSYEPQESFHSTTEFLTAEDIENSFQIIPTR